MGEKEKILQLTSGGLDIFVHYLGMDCLKKKFRSPFRDDDKRPSCKLYLNKKPGCSAYYYLQDFGDSKFSGSCFSIAARILDINPSLEFLRLLRTIDQDLCLGVFDESVKEGHVPKSKPFDVKNNLSASSFSATEITFQAETKEYSKEELAFWNRYGILPEVLSKYNVMCLKSCAFTKANGSSFGIYSTALTPIFGYIFHGGEGIKVYRPRSENRFMYAGKLPNPYVFGWEQLPKSGEMVIITGGEKDVLSLCSHGFPAISFNSETAKVPHSMMQQLASRFQKIVFLYDADATGKAESARRVAELGAQYPVEKVNLPLAGSKKEKDVSDFFAMGGTRNALKDIIDKSLNTNQK